MRLYFIQTLRFNVFFRFWKAPPLFTVPPITMRYWSLLSFSLFFMKAQKFSFHMRMRGWLLELSYSEKWDENPLDRCYWWWGNMRIDLGKLSTFSVFFWYRSLPFFMSIILSIDISTNYEISNSINMQTYDMVFKCQ